jgi:ABC-type transport system substrate-binding protein
MDREQRVRARLTRRNFLALAGLAATSLVATACGGASATPTATAGTTTTSSATSTTAAGSSSAATTSAASTTSATQAAATTTAASASARPSGGTPAASGSPTASASSSSSSSAANVPAKFQDAPMLADQVMAGKLPAVAQRVPKTPMVITQVEKVGEYGGAWRMALVGGGDTALLLRTIGYEFLVRVDPDWKDIVPNVAASYTASPDAREFTFKLREGMKWSDGQSFDADDIMFWYEDVALNKELSPGGIGAWLTTGGKPGTVTKVDQYTVKFNFPNPNGLFLQNLASGFTGNPPTQYPAHYLKQFHKKYADPAKLDQLMKENQAADWVKLFQLKGASVPGTSYNAVYSNPDLPVLNGWIITTPYGTGNRVTCERNPFYWKVDTAGNQLPYIDKVNYDVLQDPQPLVLKAANGEIDMQDRNLATNQNKPVLTDNQQKGQFHFFETVPSSMNTMMVGLNLTHKNQTLRQVFQNRDFRIGLSYALKRQEIIDTVYVGQGEPWQGAPRKEMPFYNEQLAKQYTEYDVAKANAALDKAFSKKDAQGFRLGPDGKRITFSIEVAGASDPTWADALKLVVGYWQQVGIDSQMKNEDRALLFTRKDANEHDAVIWGGDSGLKDAYLRPYWYLPMSVDSDFWAPAWSTWYYNRSGAGAQTPPEEPPDPIKQQQALYDQLQATADPAKQADFMKQILAIAPDQFWVIGISLPSNGYGVVKNNFHNVPKTMFSTGGPYINPAPTNTCQYFFE